MRMVELIERKRDGHELSESEIDYVIQGYTSGDIPDYQMSAFAMAIFFQGMSSEERVHLTMAMVESGEQIDLSGIQGIKVDKHSTGGVGDTTTMIVAPMVAAVGVPVAKMSGRGLGHTGGTIDKLESVPGFHVEIDNKQFNHLVNTNHIAVVGQSGNLTPADKKLYGLRDVTATVESIPLIASSIMSKKIASGADAIVLDVKIGSGAFMKKLNDAQELARCMVDIGNRVGRTTVAIISDMNQPLGNAVGNALEIREAIETLQGRGSRNLYELCLTLGSHMVLLAHKADNLEDARKMLEEAVASGRALDTFRTFLSAQGGDAKVIEDPARLPTAAFVYELEALEDGFIASIQADQIGTAAMLLGAGRQTKDSVIDLSVGLVLHRKIGDAVQKGDALVTIHSNSEQNQEVEQIIYAAYGISQTPVSPPKLIYEVITK
jgi:pyrimidine-nucleoside phosphorylase